MLKRGLLLVNLGTPESPSVPHVRKYLREFLMDPRVIDISYPLRFLLVNGIIAPFRAAKSAEAYHKIWTGEGSPLYFLSRKLVRAVQQRVNMPVALAMRYGSPSSEQSLRALKSAGVEEVKILPLFPHYAMSSYESAAEEATRQANRLGMNATVVPPFYRNEGYIAALRQVSEPLLKSADHVLFSFHGVPERHLSKSDPTGNTCLRSGGCCDAPNNVPNDVPNDVPNGAHGTCYRHQCFQTVAHSVKALGLAEGSYSVAFQSRLGRDEWLKPATDQHLIGLARNGVKRLAVICPSFTADCLETLEEIGIRGRESFLEAGGEELTLVPCLNDHPAWVDEVVRMASGTDTANMTTETVSTVLKFDASPEELWRRVMTYEEVPGQPPFLLRSLLPVPTGTTGDKSRVGAEIFCRYKGGELVKRMTAVDPPHLLRFVVTEQRLGIEHRVRTVEGSYELLRRADQTEVVLTTQYRSFQKPRFFWLPIERFLAHQLHRHILRGMRTAITPPEVKCQTLPSLSQR